MEDRIESYVVEHEGSTIEDLRYLDVFPEDYEAVPESFDAILNRLAEERPEDDLDTIYEEAVCLSKRKK